MIAMIAMRKEYRDVVVKAATIAFRTANRGTLEFNERGLEFTGVSFDSISIVKFLITKEAFDNFETSDAVRVDLKTFLKMLRSVPKGTEILFKITERELVVEFLTTVWKAKSLKPESEKKEKLLKNYKGFREPSSVDITVRRIPFIKAVRRCLSFGDLIVFILNGDELIVKSMNKDQFRTVAGSCLTVLNIRGNKTYKGLIYVYTCLYISEIFDTKNEPEFINLSFTFGNVLKITMDLKDEKASVSICIAPVVFEGGGA